MRSEIHPPERQYNQDEWTPWFALMPVKAKVLPDVYESPWRWAWLEWVECRYDSRISYEYAYNEYRLPAGEP